MAIGLALLPQIGQAQTLTYPIVDTGQTVCCVRGGDVTLFPAGDSIAGCAGLTVESTGSSQPVQLGGQFGPGKQPPSGNQQPGVRPGQQNGQSGQPPLAEPVRQPPQEAIVACGGQRRGAACQVTTPQGVVTGTCNLIQQQLACVPIGGPLPGQ